jgi:hypothetical protein
LDAFAKYFWEMQRTEIVERRRQERLATMARTNGGVDRSSGLRGDHLDGGGVGFSGGCGDGDVTMVGDRGGALGGDTSMADATVEDSLGDDLVDIVI